MHTSSSQYSPSFSHFRLPHTHPHSHSQTYPAIPVSDIPLETALPCCALRGSLDPATGIFCKAPEHTRIRTAQACDKCRVRKAKCSGDHPICERCHIRGLTCHYAPEQRTHRWSKAKAEQDAVLDRSTSQSGVVPQSSDALQPARPRSKSGGTSTSQGPPSCNVDADHPRSVSGAEGGGGNGNGQPIGGTALQARPRRATIASAEIRSSSSLSPEEREPSFSRQIFDLRCGGPDILHKDHGYPVSDSHSSVPVHVGVVHEALETTEESMVCGEADGEGTLGGDNDFGLNTPHIVENALALCFDPYKGDTSALLEFNLTPGATGDVSRVTLADHDLAYINPGLIAAEYSESIDGTQYPILFHHLPRSYRSGPEPESRFDMSSVILGTMSNDERPSLCCASDAESPDRTPSTSSSASPILTRASSDGLPTTPTNSNLNSPFGFASLSPHLGPSVSGDSNAYPLTTSEVLTMDMGMDGRHYHHDSGGGDMPIEYVQWYEIKDEGHLFMGDLDLFVDMDAVF